MTAYKQPGEALTFAYEFDNALPVGVTIAGIVAGFPASAARAAGANLVEALAGRVVGARSVSIRWTGGVIGESYLTTVRITDSSGDSHERDGEIRVVDQGFTVPTGLSSRYLTGEEYVLRYGEQETVRLTDETRAGVVDGGRLETALRDASDFADGYIGTSYTLPLASVPRVVKSIVAALARELLHKTRPTPEVKDAADRARLQLKDIAAGRMTLPVDVGATAPVSSGSRLARTSGDSSTAFKDALAGYSIGAGYAVPRWRQ